MTYQIERLKTKASLFHFQELLSILDPMLSQLSLDQGHLFSVSILLFTDNKTMSRLFLSDIYNRDNALSTVVALTRRFLC